MYENTATTEAPAETAVDTRRYLGTATYSPDDNKLRMAPFARLSREDYDRVKALGFAWAPKQELFVAGMWTPAREDLLVEFCGSIDDEDKTLEERAEERAERFEDYSEKRAADAAQARAGVARIADGIPLGQPILIGHHSERRARKDAQRIEDGMRRTVKMWETSEYWKHRAAGAIRHARYKERPDVRARRIKTIEADLRKVERNIASNRALHAAWTAVDSHAAAYFVAGRSWLNVADDDRGGHWTAYDVLRPDAERYQACPALTWDDVRARALAILDRYPPTAQRWIDHYNNRLAYERAMLEDSGYIAPPKRATKAVLPLLNYGGPVSYRDMYASRERISTEEAMPITKAELAKIPNDYKGTRIAADGTHRVRIAFGVYLKVSTEGCADDTARSNRRHHYYVVYVTDAKQHPRPGAELDTRAAEEVQARIEKAQATIEQKAEARSRVAAHNAAVIRTPTTPRPERPAELDAMRAALAAGVQVVSAPQLFPTPADLARRMVEAAGLEPGLCVLEPSAGTGAIVRAILEAVDTEVLGYEINGALCTVLRNSFPSYKLQVRCKDFLTVTEFAGCYPRVIMNPPFSNGDDIRHIKHAVTMLAPGGRLVAICANGPRQQEILRPLAENSGGWYEALPAGTFAEQGTNVNTAILVIEGGAS
jgi:phospholipid N-methyltransferase